MDFFISAFAAFWIGFLLAHIVATNSNKDKRK